MTSHSIFLFFFFNDTATTEIYTLSLHELFRSTPGTLRQRRHRGRCRAGKRQQCRRADGLHPAVDARNPRSEEHTSELQSRLHLVCRLLLEKKKKSRILTPHNNPIKSHEHV